VQTKTNLKHIVRNQYFENNATLSHAMEACTLVDCWAAVMAARMSPHGISLTDTAEVNSSNDNICRLPLSLLHT